MTIKQDADNSYFIKNPEERRLAVQLGQDFTINFGKKHGQFSFWLAEPKTHMKERFGLQQEVLVIYSSHSKTDARVLTAIENIIRSPDFKHRIEKVLFLLIHNGDPGEADNILNNQQDWVVVAILSEELFNPHKGNFFLRSKIARKFGSLDLFGMSSPITSDNYLFGRDQLIQTLQVRCVSRHENSGLFGLRKTGKTSVLYAIQRRLADRSVLAEYLDCHNPGVHAARWWQVLENLAEKCGNTLKREHKRDGQVKGNYNQEQAGIQFCSDIKAILEYGQLDRVLVMLDEIEFITPGLSSSVGNHWDKDFVPFWQTIRATHQETQGGFTFIVAGVNPASVEKSHFDKIPNPIFQLAVPHYLEPLSKQSVRDMVRTIGKYTGLNLNEDVYSHLQETYGGHPYLIRIACSEVWKALDTSDLQDKIKVTVNHFRERRAEIKHRLTLPIRDILLSLVWWYQEEYDLLRILAGGDTGFVDDYLKSQPDSVAQFAKYGLLNENSDRFAIADLKEFLIENGERYKKEISPFTRGDIPQEFLPEMPDLSLLGRLFEKRCEAELKLRKLIITYLGVRNNWNPGKIAESMIKGLHPRQDRRNPTDLFIGRKPQDVINDLYTLDLKAIISANWDAFGPLFDDNKSRFEMNMDTINLARRIDGHAKPFNAIEISDFENSYSWLNLRLSKVPL